MLLLSDKVDVSIRRVKLLKSFVERVSDQDSIGRMGRMGRKLCTIALALYLSGTALNLYFLSHFSVEQLDLKWSVSNIWIVSGECFILRKIFGEFANGVAFSNRTARLFNWMALVQVLSAFTIRMNCWPISIKGWSLSFSELTMRSKFYFQFHFMALPMAILFFSIGWLVRLGTEFKEERDLTV